MASRRSTRSVDEAHRIPVSVDDREAVLQRCRRRCCLCFGLRGDLGVKNGQLAHLDRNPANSTQENLAFLCQECHTNYDQKSNRVLGFTPGEVLFYRSRLYAALAHDRFEWSLTVRADRSEIESIRRVVDEAYALLMAATKEVTRKEGPVEP